MSDERYPIKTPLMVVPGDNENGKRTIGFTMYEHIGAPIYDAETFSPDNSILDDANRLTKVEDAYEGRWVFILSPFYANCGYKVQISKRDDAQPKSAEAYSGKIIHELLYDDTRGCWVCVGSANVEDLKKLELFSTKGDE